MFIIIYKYTEEKGSYEFTQFDLVDGNTDELHTYLKRVVKEGCSSFWYRIDNLGCEMDECVDIRNQLPLFEHPGDNEDAIAYYWDQEVKRMIDTHVRLMIEDIIPPKRFWQTKRAVPQ